jgi:activator of 2-hydroxyglutaryl-CoA dehydratase
LKLKLIYYELRELLEKLGYKLVLDKGSFNTGYCLLEDEKMIVINKNKPYENRIKILSEILSKIDTDNIYIKPKIRELINQQ